MLKKFLLSKNVDCGLLALRVAVGLLMAFPHGLSKLEAFNDKAHGFINPVGLGPELSYTLVVFAEFFCSLLLVLGLFTRLAVIPLIINALVIVFVVFLPEPWGKKEFPFLFLMAYVAILFMGPGKYSLDYLLFGKE